MGSVLGVIVLVCITVISLACTLGLSIIKRYLYFHPEAGNYIPRELSPGISPFYHNHISGLYAPGARETSKTPLVLFCHGNAGNIYSRLPKLEALAAFGYSVLLFDYSGYGLSTGDPSEELCYTDADMMYQYATETLGFQAAEIGAYGESLGGPVAAYIAGKYRLPCLILESALPSVGHLIKSKLPSCLGFLGNMVPDFDVFRNLQAAGMGYRGQILHMHSPSDEIIPYVCTVDLQNHATEHIAIQGGHNTPNIPWRRVNTFLQRVFPASVD